MTTPTVLDAEGRVLKVGSKVERAFAGGLSGGMIGHVHSIGWWHVTVMWRLHTLRRPKVGKEPWKSAGWFWAESAFAAAQSLADSPWWGEYEALIVPQGPGDPLWVRFRPSKVPEEVTHGD